jgi:hypothetical protein
LTERPNVDAPVHDSNSVESVRETELDSVALLHSLPILIHVAVYKPRTPGGLLETLSTIPKPEGTPLAAGANYNVLRHGEFTALLQEVAARVGGNTLGRVGWDAGQFC